MSDFTMNDLLKSAVKIDRRLAGDILNKKDKTVELKGTPEPVVEVVEERKIEYADELSDLNSNGLIELIETSDPEKLEEIKAFESEGKNRQGVMKAIAKKEAEFSEATE